MRVNSRLSNSLSFISIAVFTIWFVRISNAPVFAQTSGTWTATGMLNFPRVAHSATLLADRQVLVVGENDASGNLVYQCRTVQPSHRQMDRQMGSIDAEIYTP